MSATTSVKPVAFLQRASNHSQQPLRSMRAIFCVSEVPVFVGLPIHGQQTFLRDGDWGETPNAPG
jgi:hypothetical protein